MHNHLETNWRKQFDAARDFGATGLVCCEQALPDSLSMGQRLNVPVFLAAQRPCIASSSMPPIGVPATPAILNKLMHWSATQLLALEVNERVVRFRAKLGLHDQLDFNFSRIPQVLFMSSLFLPRPADYRDNVLMCGFARLPAELVAKYTPPPPLAAFLALNNDDASGSGSSSDARPILVALGEMPTPDGNDFMIISVFFYK